VADYCEMGIVNPCELPAVFFDKNDLLVLRECGFTMQERESPEGNVLYFFVEDGLLSSPDLPEDLRGKYGDDMPWVDVFQNVLRKSRVAGKPIGYIYFEAALTCTRMLGDGFGGYAVFIEEKRCQQFGTGRWIADRISEFQSRH